MADFYIEDYLYFVLDMDTESHLHGRSSGIVLVLRIIPFCSNVYFDWINDDYGSLDADADGTKFQSQS
ncbi:hypothetical protein EBQ91_02105 [bacterium]|nr:hypothetical protein [bacterium]